MNITVRNTTKLISTRDPSSSSWQWQIQVLSRTPKKKHQQRQRQEQKPGVTIDSIKSTKLRRVSLELDSNHYPPPCCHDLSKAHKHQKSRNTLALFESKEFVARSTEVPLDVKLDLLWTIEDSMGNSQQHSTTIVHRLGFGTEKAYYESHHIISFPNGTRNDTNATTVSSASATAQPQPQPRSQERGEMLDMSSAKSTAPIRHAESTTPATPIAQNIVAIRRDHLDLLSQQGYIPRPRQRLIPSLLWHGRLGAMVEDTSDIDRDGNALIPPIVTWRSEEAPRQDHHNGTDWLTATEYRDMDMTTLDWKLEMLTNLLRVSQKTVVYSGAGISCVAGIAQAARGSDTHNGSNGTPIDNPLSAQPTITHHALTALWKAGLIHGWVQQNHDGLPQKAGFPQEHINEVHGSWYDPANPVVLYSGDLRSMENNWMQDDAKTADLVLVLGTSLSGLTADEVATKAADRSKHGRSLGMVVINLQQTPQDHKASLRIFGRSDDIFVAVMDRLSIDPLPTPLPTFHSVLTKIRRALVPYNDMGELIPEEQKTCSGRLQRKMWLDLQPGEAICITDGHNLYGSDQDEYKLINRSKNAGQPKGVVVGWDDETCSIHLQIQGVHMEMGQWWLEAAIRGGPIKLPIVNLYPKYER
eukprot:CAMPEP_0197435470 /NCGR_PEP_ID=MMETSP1175-20131217/3051_1 /TAXON_ID=1003142 /ORGANISM="Triceratium dubium, Strain CCMP147" /LENGTH=640 /DNA_ID=CAMNT_0042964515 /DNA_START=1078 /DNA_END=3000 /DNA_ORIENTATION=+